MPPDAVTNDLGKVGPIDDGLRGLRALGVGGDHACATRSDATVVCWGRNGHGELGTGSSDDRSATPAQVIGLDHAIALGLGKHHGCATREDRTVSCWGHGRAFGADDDAVPAPRRIDGLDRVRALAAGEDHTCALREGGTLVCWGENDEGQLGDGTRERHETPTPVASTARFVAVAAGDRHTCAIASKEAIACWGDNERGQLGDGTMTARPAPTAVAWRTDREDLPDAQAETAGARSPQRETHLRGKLLAAHGWAATELPA